MNYLTYAVWFIALVLITVGVIFILKKDKKRVTAEQSLTQKAFEPNKKSLKTKLEVFQGKTKQNFVQQYIRDVKMILIQKGQPQEFRKVKIKAAAMALLGILIASEIGNNFLAPVFAVFLGSLPFVSVKKDDKKYKNLLNTQLETAVLLITSAYQKNITFVSAVQETLPSLPSVVKPYFQAFVTEVTMINADVESAINNLQLKIDNPLFRRWCRRVITSLSDNSIKKSLFDIAKDFTDKRVTQAQLDAQAYNAKKDLRNMEIFTLAAPFLLYLLEKDWGSLFFTNTIGKIMLAVDFVIVIIIHVIGAKIAVPVEFRSGGDD